MRQGECLEVTVSNMFVCKAPCCLKAESIDACVSVAIWDRETQVGGMVEVMQPQTISEISFCEIGQYANTGIKELVRRMELYGANPERLEAKIAGGSFLKDLQRETGIGNIGIQNVIAIKKELQDLGVELLAEDVGKEGSRTILFDPETGDCRIEIPGMEERYI